MIGSEIRHIFLPYCIQRLSDGRFIVLNRKYKPLGIGDSAWIDYDSHPSVVAIKGLTAARAKRLSHKSEESVDAIYLYGDGCVPTDSVEHWAAYAKRLEILAGLQLG